MKIFITGTESFVGKELIAQCDKRNIELFSCDYIQPVDKRFRQMDIRSKDINDVIPENVDAIVHLAALSTDQQCRNNAYECFDINVLGTLNLINAAHKRNAKHFVFASTEWVYGGVKGDEVQNEDSVIDIRKLKGEYALSKLVSENNLRQAYENGFCDVTILRFGIIYGPRKSNWSAVEALFNDVTTKDIISVGSLRTGRCFIHVSDIADGIIKSIGLQGFNVINLQGNKLITLKDIIETSKKILNKNPNIIEKDPNKISLREVSNKKAKELLGWEPKIDLGTGLLLLKEQLEGRIINNLKS